jgi:macrolide-specific efflux system membrane fusion protein
VIQLQKQDLIIWGQYARDGDKIVLKKKIREDMMESHCKKVLLIITLSVSILLINGCSLFPMEEDVLTPPLEEPEEITYRTDEARVGYIEDSIQRSAYFVPIMHENLFFRYRGGRMKAVHVKPGDTVKAGDVVAELLTDNLEREIEQQSILVDSRIKDCLYTEQLAEIEINASKDKLKALENKYQSMRQKTEVYTANEIERVFEEMKNQQVLVEKIELNYLNQVEIKKNELALAELKLKQLKEELELNKLGSPVSGIVTYISNIKEGDMVDAYTTVVTIADPTVLHLEYKGDSASDFKLGMKVELTINKETYQGEVVLTPTSVPYEQYEKYKDTVLIKPEVLPAGVEKGDRASIRLVRDFSENAVIIPKRALRSYMGKNLVYVLEDGLRVEKYVKTGVQTSTEVEIIEGILPGELVILD